jgi:hypothetical protein
MVFAQPSWWKLVSGNKVDVTMFFGIACDNFPGAVCGLVVIDKNLVDGLVLGQKFIEEGGNVLFFVAGRDEHGNALVQGEKVFARPQAKGPPEVVQGGK